MKHLIIIGASGFGRDLYDMATESRGYGNEFVVKGFLVHKDAYLHSMDAFEDYPSILGTIDNYKIEEDDVFVCALGDPEQKERSINVLKSKGASFFSIIHNTANVSKSAIIGEGCVIEQNAFVGSGAIIGSHSLVQLSSVVGHDCKVGSYSRIDCHVVLVGGSQVGDSSIIHTAAIINGNVIVGSKCVVGASSFVIRKVLDGNTVFGNPAKKL